MERRCIVPAGRRNPKAERAIPPEQEVAEIPQSSIETIPTRAPNAPRIDSPDERRVRNLSFAEKAMQAIVRENVAMKRSAKGMRLEE